MALSNLPWTPSALSRAEARRASRLLRAMGRKLPRCGWSEELLPAERLPDGHPVAIPVRISRDRHGYYLTGQFDTAARRAAWGMPS